MNKAEDLLALAARVEAGEWIGRGVIWDFEREIGRAVGWSPKYRDEVPPPYLSSFDVAAGLTDWEFTLFRGDEYSEVEIGDMVLGISSTAKTAPAALTAAALRALAHQEPKP